MKNLLIAIAALVTISTPTLAQNCAPTEMTNLRLVEKYGEQLTDHGIANSEAIVELWSSDAGSFTIIVRRTNGLSCLIASGQLWQPVTQKPQGDGL